MGYEDLSEEDKALVNINISKFLEGNQNNVDPIAYGMPLDDAALKTHIGIMKKNLSKPANLMFLRHGIVPTGQAWTAVVSELVQTSERFDSQDFRITSRDDGGIEVVSGLMNPVSGEFTSRIADAYGMGEAIKAVPYDLGDVTHHTLTIPGDTLIDNGISAVSAVINGYIASATKEGLPSMDYDHTVRAALSLSAIAAGARNPSVEFNPDINSIELRDVTETEAEKIAERMGIQNRPQSTLGDTIRIDASLTEQNQMRANADHAIREIAKDLGLAEMHTKRAACPRRDWSNSIA